MGNCCSSSSDENFKGDGRTLGSNPTNAPAPSNNARASVPPKVTGEGRTLGNNKPGSQATESPKEAAARAAEERAARSSQSGPKGKLGKQLEAQRAQTQTSTLAQNARENVAHRDADAAASTRQYN